MLPLRVLCPPHLSFGGRPLPAILSWAGYEPLCLKNLDSIGHAIAHLPHPPDLVVLPLEGDQESALGRIRTMRATERARFVPVLAVGSLAQTCFDIRMLRSHGIVGLVDSRLDAATIIERIRQASPGGRSRVSERAPCFFPVLIKREGAVAHEYALDLSASGMRLTSEELLEPNTDLTLHFSLPMIAGDRVQVRARTVHRRSLQNSAGRYEVGVFFYPPSQRYQRIIDQEVARLLSG